MLRDHPYIIDVCDIMLSLSLLTSSWLTGFVNSLNFLSANNLLVVSLRNTLNSRKTASRCLIILSDSISVNCLGKGGGASGRGS